MSSQNWTIYNKVSFVACIKALPVLYILIGCKQQVIMCCHLPIGPFVTKCISFPTTTWSISCIKARFGPYSATLLYKYVQPLWKCHSDQACKHFPHLSCSLRLWQANTASVISTVPACLYAEYSNPITWEELIPTFSHNKLICVFLHECWLWWSIAWPFFAPRRNYYFTCAVSVH